MSASGSKLWGGRFDRPPDEAFYEFQRSFPFDRRLLPYELEVNRAWTRAIEKAGLLTAAEAASILTALDQIEARAGGDPAWVENSDAEDVHHLVESALVDAIGPTGWKVHTGRSRNDLVATDFRLFVRDATAASGKALGQLVDSLLTQAEHHAALPMPGMTHLQHAQPMLFAHFLLAHVEGFFRDLDRLEAARRATRPDQTPRGLRPLLQGSADLPSQWPESRRD